MRYVWIIMFLLCVVPAELAAQTPFFQQYFLLRKNDPVQINDILQVKNGTMWFATNKGLFSFDGMQYNHYSIKNGLPHEVVTSLAEDSLGRLWTGYSNGQIGYHEGNRFQSFRPEEGLSIKLVSKIHFDAKGVLWFSTHDDGLYYYVAGRLHRIDEAEGMPDLFIYDIAEDPLGNIWAGTDGGVAICTLTEGQLSIDVLDYDDGLPDNIIRRIIPDNGKAMLLATEDAGLLRIDLATKKHTSFASERWTNGPVTDAVVDNDNIWVSCPQKGLLLLNRNDKKERLFSLEQYPGLHTLRVLTTDYEGNLWIGTRSTLLRTPGEGLQYIHEPAGTRNTNTLALTVGLDGDIWFANSDGLFRRKHQTNVVEPVSGIHTGKSPVISLYTDSFGFVWAGLYGDGVMRVNPRNGKVVHLKNQLRNGNVLGITGDQSTVWLATLGGVTRITIGADEGMEIENFSREDGLNSDFIYQVFLENGRAWFSTDGQGLGMLNRNGFHVYKDGLPNAALYGVAQDSKRRLWANVQGHGLFVFDGTRFNPADSNLRVRDKNIHSLAADRNGNIVVMHDVGMDLIDIARNRVIHLGEEVGIRDKTGNLNAVNKDLYGNIYFGTTGGIITFTTTDRMLENKPLPQIKYISFRDKFLDVDGKALAYDENNLKIGFLGVWYKNPEGIFYSYQLENYDSDWITTRDRSVTYSQLPPGNYRFRVRTSESENFDDAAESSLSFTILPPIWQTFPFYITTGLLMIVVIFSIVHQREKKLRRYNDLLEQKVAMRTREIQVQNEEIQAQNEEISAQSEEIMRINENLEEMVQERTGELEKKNKALEEYAFINAHKLRSPVATILGLLNLISKTKLDPEALEINRRLQHTADELDCVVRSITKAIERADRKIPKVKDD